MAVIVTNDAVGVPVVTVGLKERVAEAVIVAVEVVAVGLDEAVAVGGGMYVVN